MSEDARRAAERAAREGYGRLLALVAARSRDIAAAEDALAEAFRLALETWPRRGAPDRPEAWLLTVARRAVGRAARAGRVRDAAAATLETLAEEARDRAPSAFPDKRLALLFACAHPAIGEAARTPLMLQTVLGLDAARIGAAFLVPPATMGQRLVRAKHKIRDAGVPFEEPDPRELPERLEAVLAAVYAAYGAAFDAGPADDGAEGLAEEAIHLARLLVALLPREPEARGLLALTLYAHARAPARRGPDGAYVPLDEQDPRLWRREAIVEAEGELVRAARAGAAGRYQIEAALQSLHVRGALAGRRSPEARARLYDLLVETAPTIGAQVARAAAIVEARGPRAGLAALDAIDPERVGAYQPYWAARAHLLAAAGEGAQAAAAYARAIALATDPAVRRHLEARAATL